MTFRKSQCNQIMKSSTKNLSDVNLSSIVLSKRTSYTKQNPVFQFHLEEQDEKEKEFLGLLKG